MITMWLPHMTARVIATAWRCPPESELTLLRSGGSVTPKRSKALCTSRRIAPFCRWRTQPPNGTGPAALALEEDVLGDVERGDQREVLEDRLDAGVAGVRRAREAPLRAVHEHPALVGPQCPGHHAHERALAGAVVADQPEHLAARAARG